MSQSRRNWILALGLPLEADWLPIRHRILLRKQIGTCLLLMTSLTVQLLEQLLRVALK